MFLYHKKYPQNYYSDLGYFQGCHFRSDQGRGGGGQLPPWRDFFVQAEKTGSLLKIFTLIYAILNRKSGNFLKEIPQGELMAPQT